MSKEIGSIIKARRESMGWNLDYLSKQIGTTVSGLSKMEAGHQKIDSETLIRLSEEFNMSLDDFLNRRKREQDQATSVRQGTRSYSIAEDLLKVIINYSVAKKEDMSSHPMSNHIRKTLKTAIYNETGLDPETYHVVGSVGQGQWAEVPWVSIFMRDITISATNGYYIVYLFNADGSGVYVSLNQGWTYFREKYGTKMGVQMIKQTASIMRKNLHMIPSDLHLQSIDLNGRGPLAKGYEAGHICGTYYPADDFPSSEKIIQDLLSLINVYSEIHKIKGVRSVAELNDFLLLEVDGLFLEDSHAENPFQMDILEQVKEERLPLSEDEKKERRLPVRGREGKEFYPRRSYISALAIKESGYQCLVDPTHSTFTSKASKHPYVESHHIVPMSLQEQFDNELDQVANIAALCPNCHRLVHLGKDSEREELLRSLFIKRRDRLERIGIEITFSQLKRMYDVDLEQ